MNHLHTRIPATAWLVLPLWMSSLPAAPAVERHEGQAYPRGGGAVLYREEHLLYRAAGEARQLVMYRCPDGAPFARKLLHDSPTSAQPDYDFVDARRGEREGVRTVAEGREVYLQGPDDATERSRVLDVSPDAVIDAGFDPYVRAHWDALATSEPRVSFLLAARMRFVPVRLGNVRDVTENGTPVRRLRLKLDAWYGFALPTVELTYDRSDRRLVRFAGKGSIRGADGHHQDVRIEFPSDRHTRDLPTAVVDAALAAPLVHHCGK